MTRWPRRPMAHGLRVALWTMSAVAVPVLATVVLALRPDLPAWFRLAAVSVAALCALSGVIGLRRTVTRPLHTLANLLAGLRRGDYSLRSSRARPDDELGVVMLEANALADTLTEQRIDAIEANALLRKVMAEIDPAVFAFDEDGVLRLVNRAGERWLARPRERLEGESAAALGLADYLEGPTPRTVELAFAGATGRGELRRRSFRQGGRPHTLVVVSDLSRALRQQELDAWRRLVRVISHEINNSLAPIGSFAGSLQRLHAREPRPADYDEDLLAGLRIIEQRSESLRRFMAAYAKLARLPAPQRRAVDVAALLARVAALTGGQVELTPGPAVELLADPDQLEQLLINLVGNALDAVRESAGHVRATWSVDTGELVIHIVDDGPGLANTANLFVPFFSTKPGGSGIGLALSRQIAESHGGSVDLRNREDERGCAAVIRLPLTG